MNSRKVTLNIIIDNKPYQATAGLTILQAAEENDIYIPTLCAHKDLSSYGGCRICIVDVEGMRAFPTACTTPISEGMVIRTHTMQVQAARKEILQLFMSEHPSSCLICDEREECLRYLETIHKAGVTTSCRYCPNNEQCELQDVVEYLGIEELDYPIFYRNLPPEKQDPFYDRDYNLCILCGRCVRMCQEVRLANVLAFKHRGRQTVIGPAYHRNHFEAGCEFCGACVSVCPTGTLAEKARKWDGKPDHEQITTCNFCGVGCQMRLLVRKGRIIGSLPQEDPFINRGQLCVKGRFGVAEMVNGYQRLSSPQKAFQDTRVEIDWPAAIRQAAEKLSHCAPHEFGMLISPNLSNEDIFVAQKFTRMVMQSHQVDSAARLFYGAGFNTYLRLMQQAVPLTKVRDAEVILCIGLDTRFGRSVVGVELRRALHQGARIITLNPRNHNLALTAHKWIRNQPGTELDLLNGLLSLVRKKNKTPAAADLPPKIKAWENELFEVAQLLQSASHSVILVGTEFMHYQDIHPILTVIQQLSIKTKSGVLPLPAQNNLYGSLIMGGYPEILPGGYSARDLQQIKKLNARWHLHLKPYTQGWNALALLRRKKLKVLYLLGEFPPLGKTLPTDFIISQNIYPPPAGLRADLVLPAAAFTEIDGTVINQAGRIQAINKAVEPPGEALPDWQILARLAQEMDVKGLDYRNVEQIHTEMATFYDPFKDLKAPDRNPFPLPVEVELNVPKPRPNPLSKQRKKYPYILMKSMREHLYKGTPLTRWVDGARRIFPEGQLNISPADAKQLDLSEGDRVVMQAARREQIWPVRIAPELQPGILHITLSAGELKGPNPQRVNIRKKNV